MKYYSGLDVSLKGTFISIVDEKGKIVKEEVVASESSAIAGFLLSQDKEYESIGIESGQLSISMCKNLFIIFSVVKQQRQEQPFVSWC